MGSSNFIDHVNLYVRAGKGGAGSMHLRREKSVPKGGPDGGDGGRGGHIILEGSSHVSTLLHLRYKKHIIAEDGGAGEGQQRFGATGSDVVLKVPLGTVAKQTETGKKLLEITEDGQQAVLVQGGRGGLGNVHFKSPTRQTPRYAQPGEVGKEEWVSLELKLLADVGLVGFPNAGKSTLLSVVSAAKPKIADYPFTTLVPQLGIVAYRDEQSFVMADIPGIIEGAASGKGLGTRFLRHIERNAGLLFVIAADALDINATYQTLIKELRDHNPTLLDKPRLLVVSKSDMLDEELKTQLQETLPTGLDHVFISALGSQGLVELKDAVWRLLHP